MNKYEWLHRHIEATRKADKDMNRQPLSGIAAQLVAVFSCPQYNNNFDNCRCTE